MATEYTVLIQDSIVNMLYVLSNSLQIPCMVNDKKDIMFLIYM